MRRWLLPPGPQRAKRALEPKEPGAHYRIEGGHRAAPSFFEKILPPETRPSRGASHRQERVLAPHSSGQAFECGLTNFSRRLGRVSLAAAQGLPDAASARDELKRTMTREQIAESRRRIDAFAKPNR